jgi:mxaA protein
MTIVSHRCAERGYAAAAMLASLAMLIAGPAQAAPVPAVVQQPRAYGRVLGDVLTQRVLLEDAAGRTEFAVPPPAARVNAWFERMPSHAERDAEGRHWLRIDYQIINAPRGLELGSLPSFTLALKSGNTVAVPEWPISIGPLTPDVVYDKGDLLSVRPDRAATPYSVAAVRRQLLLWSGLLGLTLLAWLSWWSWRNARDAARLPFARAARVVQRIGPPDNTESWVALHRAFNETAGRVVQPDSLAALFERAPYLASLRADIERFYAVSSERFFAPSPVSASVPLAELSRALKQAEKQGEQPRGV